jgi:hypothetical protein
MRRSTGGPGVKHAVTAAIATSSRLALQCAPRSVPGVLNGQHREMARRVSRRALSGYSTGKMLFDKYLTEWP